MTLGSMLPGADFSQLSTLPRVIQHYELHQQIASQKGQQLSIHQFLYDHFWQQNSHDHEDGGQSHKDLPLKHVHSFSHLTLQFSRPVFTLPSIVRKQMVTVSLNHLSTIYIGAVFRPPIG
jgi:hypothetical protein